MNSRQAEHNLTVIRTLMERSTVYRRALGPIFILAGCLGTAAAAAGLVFHIHREQDFAVLWIIVAIVTVSLATLMTRRQALKDQQSFWSAPTRRVALALLPPLLVGAVFTGYYECQPWNDHGLGLMVVWMILYGSGLHAAGFFTPRAVRFLGWAFLTGGTALAGMVLLCPVSFSPATAHALMGASFGGLHLVCGLYLRVTQKGSNDA